MYRIHFVRLLNFCYFWLFFKVIFVCYCRTNTLTERTVSQSKGSTFSLTCQCAEYTDLIGCCLISILQKANEAARATANNTRPVTVGGERIEVKDFPLVVGVNRKPESRPLTPTSNRPRKTPPKIPVLQVM